MISAVTVQQLVIEYKSDHIICTLFARYSLSKPLVNGNFHMT
jgi:hypothetical protein